MYCNDNYSITGIRNATHGGSYRCETILCLHDILEGSRVVFPSPHGNLSMSILLSRLPRFYIHIHPPISWNLKVNPTTFTATKHFVHTYIQVSLYYPVSTVHTPLGCSLAGPTEGPLGLCPTPPAGGSGLGTLWRIV